MGEGASQQLCLPHLFSFCLPPSLLISCGYSSTRNMFRGCADAARNLGGAPCSLSSYSADFFCRALWNVLNQCRGILFVLLRLLIHAVSLLDTAVELHWLYSYASSGQIAASCFPILILRADREGISNVHILFIIPLYLFIGHKCITAACICPLISY